MQIAVIMGMENVPIMKVHIVGDKKPKGVRLMKPVVIVSVL